MDRLREVFLYVVAGVFLVVFLYGFVWGEPDSVGLYILPVLSLAALLVPLAQKMKVTSEGVEFERIREEREAAEKAAEQAAFYFGLSAVMNARLGSTWQAHQRLLRLLRRAMDDGFIGPEDVHRDVWEADEEYDDERRKTNEDFLRDLAQAGIVDIEEQDNKLVAKISPEHRDVVETAIARFEISQD